MFLADFYKAVLPDRIERECKRQPERIPVVQFRLSDGTTLDVCHIAYLGDAWLAVAFYPDSTTCDDMDYAFIPYEGVMRVTLSLRDKNTRQIGFDIARSKAADSFLAGNALAGHSLPGATPAAKGKWTDHE